MRELNSKVTRSGQRFVMGLGFVAVVSANSCGDSKGGTGDAGPSAMGGTAGSSSGSGGTENAGTTSTGGANAGADGRGGATAGSASGGKGGSSSGNAGTNAAGAGASGAGASAGASGTNATAGDAGAGASNANGGTAGTPTSGGGGEEPGGDGEWNAACGDVTMNGRCEGDVYEWCDYHTRSLKQLDCAPLGMACRANSTISYEGELNGCVGGPCTGDDVACNGAVAFECEFGEKLARDCRKLNGPDSTCFDPGGTSAGCTNAACAEASTYRCDGSVSLVCREDNTLGLTDCSRCVATGTCVEVADRTECSELSFGCEQDQGFE